MSETSSFPMSISLHRPELNMAEICQSMTGVTVGAGSEQKVFNIHTDLMCAYSGYLNRVFVKHFEETSSSSYSPETKSEDKTEVDTPGTYHDGAWHFRAAPHRSNSKNNTSSRSSSSSHPSASASTTGYNDHHTLTLPHISPTLFAQFVSWCYHPHSICASYTEYWCRDTIDLYTLARRLEAPFLCIDLLVSIHAIFTPESMAALLPEYQGVTLTLDDLEMAFKALPDSDPLCRYLSYVYWGLFHESNDPWTKTEGATAAYSKVGDELDALAEFPKSFLVRAVLVRESRLRSLELPFAEGYLSKDQQAWYGLGKVREWTPPLGQMRELLEAYNGDVVDDDGAVRSMMVELVRQGDSWGEEPRLPFEDKHLGEWMFGK
ncbi:hypothetical protein K490DRAFT_53317 [Saccharata proteae CBS 121410]|uniref:BTB domain-containing protein n=1 Tax=Saccharata proteae CBS 121410 TaxID=1314787 RepID=A0A9P4M078_9PEZI|nr:hypothetical protein K490DRAFT_53317 [Saccharata proteae CBS 121410]